VPGLAGRTGGTAFHVVDSSRALQEAGIEVSVVATDLAATAGAPSRRRIRLDELPPGADELHRLRLCHAIPPRRFAFSPELRRVIAEELEAADVLHIHSLFLYPELAAYRAAVRRGVPYIVSPHGAVDPFLRGRGRFRKSVVDALWQRRMLHHAAAVHFTTTEEARLAGDLQLGPRQAVVPTGIWADEFSRLPDPHEFRGRHGLNGLVVMFLGRLSFKKGLDVLVDAFVEAQLGDAHLVVAGPDDEGLTPGLVAAAEAAGARDRLVFTGMLQGVERLQALAATDIWVLPSYSENFGIAAVEALAAGRAVVMSPAVNIAAKVQAARAGVIVEARAPALAAELRALAADPQRRRTLGDAARRFARQYDWSSVVRGFVELYERVGARAPLD